MPPLPKKKRTQARKGRRRSHFHLQPVTLTQCPQCRSPKPPYQVCLTCGYYGGREVIAVGERPEKQES